MGSDIYTAETALCSAPGAASLPAQGHLHHRHLSGWLPLQMAAWGLTFHGVAAAEHTCGTACPLPDTSAQHALDVSSPWLQLWTWSPSHPAGSGCRKESRSGNTLKNSSAISTPATSSSFCESGLEGYLVLINPHLFTVKHSEPPGLTLGLQSLFVYWKATKNYPI